MNYLLLGECAKEERSQERAELNSYYEKQCQWGDQYRLLTVCRNTFMHTVYFTDLKVIFKEGDCVMIYRPADIVNSINRFLAFCEYLVQHGVSLHIVKSGKFNQQFLCLTPQSTALDCMRVCQLFSSDMISYRTAKLLAKRKAQGFSLGRPKGRRNKSLKLDRHEEAIHQYLKNGLGVTAIAKLVNCHPQTLCDWLERQASKTKAITESMDRDSF